MSTARKIQRDSYKLSRASGDLAALQSGGIPKLAKRLVRRRVTRSIFGMLRGMK